MGDLPVGIERAPTPTEAVWGSYSIAFKARWGVEPTRNATVNGQLANLVKRLGAQDAAEVAAFYPTMNEPRFVREKHPVGLLVQRAESVHAQWKGAKDRSPTAGLSPNLQRSIENLTDWSQEKGNGTEGS